MQSLSKKRYDQLYINDFNKIMRKNNLVYRCKSEKDFHGNYHTVWDYKCSNLPEKIVAAKIQKEALKNHYDNLIKTWEE